MFSAVTLMKMDILLDLKFSTEQRSWEGHGFSRADQAPNNSAL
jgi:hypothetical protein